jgi:hypothetical protein
VEDEGQSAQAAPASETDGAQQEGYWARRLGSRAPTSSTPAPPTPGGQPPVVTGWSGQEPETGMTSVTAVIDRPTARAPLPSPPPVPRGGWWSRRTVYYGPYKAHDSLKNWIIGASALIALIVTMIVAVLVGISDIKTNLSGTLIPVPSSGSNTVAWYWQGQLGSNVEQSRALNVPNENLSSVRTSIQDGFLTYFVALDRQGHAWMWGEAGDQHASLQVTPQPAEVSVTPGVQFTQLATNNGQVLALDQNGHIWSWGGGIADTSAPTAPAEVTTPPTATFKALSVGSGDALALDSSGHVWAWGFGSDGNLGLTTAGTVALPTEVQTFPGVAFTAVAAGTDQSVALDARGRVWTWGNDEDGELGVADTSLPTGTGSCQAAFHSPCSFHPVQAGLPTGVTITAVSAGNDIDAALDATGRIWTWGKSGVGTISSPAQSASMPAAIGPAGMRFTSVALTQPSELGVPNMMALDSHGHAWAWEGKGLLAGGTCPDRSARESLANTPFAVQCLLTPTALPGPSDGSLKRVAATPAALFAFPD